jgi:hypothetical protein
MKSMASAFIVASVLVAIASPAGAASNSREQIQRADDCVVTGWTSSSWTRPIFKCPGPDEEIHRGQQHHR